MSNFLFSSKRANKVALCVSGLVLLLSGAQTAFSQIGYSTSFDNFTGGQSLSDQEAWVTNDESVNAPDYNIGQSDYVGVLAGKSATDTDYWGSLGGNQRPAVTPSANVVYLSRPFDIKATSGGSGALLFNTDFSITSSQSPYGTRDSFAWTARNVSGQELLSLRFTPDPLNTTRLVMTLGYGVGGTSSYSASPSNNTIGSDSIYSLAIGVGSDSKASVTITSYATFADYVSHTASANTTIFSNADVSSSGVATDSVTEVAATWKLADTTTGAGGAKTGSGSNSLVFNNYSVVPEPSSIALMGMAGIGGLVAMAKRRKSLSK